MKKLLWSVMLLGLTLTFTQSAQAFRPSGWVYHNHPWAYDSGSGDWHWFNPADTQWIARMGSGQWATLPNSALGSGWVYYQWPFAYAQGNNAWHWINEPDTQWVVNMRTGQWSVFGAAAEIAGDYLIIDLSAGPSASSYPVSYTSAPPTGGWTDEFKTTKMVFRRIPAGTFIMGSSEDELGRYSNETQHQVTLTNDFYMGVFPVTQRQWERVMGDWPSYFNNTSYRDARPVEQVSYNMIRGSSAGSGWPANNNVDADSFMGRLRARTDRTFDLPTESQWEYAGRAGTTTALNSGKNLTAATGSCPNMSEVGRYYYNHPGDYSQSSSVGTEGGTAKVGSYQPNNWGLYDIHGNVWEWCLDWYGAYPGTVTNPKGPSSGSYCILRGGGFDSSVPNCRSAFRGHRYPFDAWHNFGFRVALPSASHSASSYPVSYLSSVPSGGWTD